MNFAFQTILFSLILAFSSGCSFTTGYHNYVRSTFLVKQSDHVVRLCAATDHVYPVKPGETIRETIDGELDSFRLRFDGNRNRVSVSSISGYYQFYSQKPQPLELVSLDGDFAVLVPRDHIITKPTKQSMAHVGRLEFGRYKLDIQYQINGQQYSCHFDVDYSRKNSPELHGIWELHDVN